MHILSSKYDDGTTRAPATFRDTLATADPFDILRERTFDLMETCTVDGPPIDYIIDGSLPRGVVGNISAPGSSGKSFLAIELAACVTSPLANEHLLQLPISTYSSGGGGGVVYINLEDRRDLLRQRLRALGRILPREAIVSLSKHFKFAFIGGCRASITNDRWLNSISKYCEGARLVIIDTHSRFATELNENSNNDAAFALERYGEIADAAGTATLFAHHTSKDALRTDAITSQTSTRGAAALTDNSRWQAWLQRMSEPEAKKLGISEAERPLYVQFGTSKENYGPPSPSKWFRRNQDGVLLPAPFNKTFQKAKAAALVLGAVKLSRRGGRLVEG